MVRVWNPLSQLVIRRQVSRPVVVPRPLVVPADIPRKDCPSPIESALDCTGITVRKPIWEQRDGLDEPMRSYIPGQTGRAGETRSCDEKKSDGEGTEAKIRRRKSEEKRPSQFSSICRGLPES